MAQKKKKEEDLFAAFGAKSDVSQRELSTAGQQAKAETTQAKAETTQAKVEAVRKADIKSNDDKFVNVKENASRSFSELDPRASRYRDAGVRERYGRWKSADAERERAVEAHISARDEERGFTAVNLSRANENTKRSFQEYYEYTKEVDPKLAEDSKRHYDSNQGAYDAAVADAMKLHVFDTPAWNVVVEQQRFNEWYNSVFVNWKLYGNLMAAELTTEQFLKGIDEKKEVALGHSVAINEISYAAKTNEEAATNVAKYLAEHKTELEGGVPGLPLLYSMVGITGCAKDRKEALKKVPINPIK